MGEMTLRVYRVAPDGAQTETHPARVVNDCGSGSAALAHPSEIFPPCTCSSADCPDRNKRHRS
jgi:hypothetical protein